MNDLEFVYTMHTAGNIDIRQTHPALSLSSEPETHEFANTMIQDHAAVYEAALGLVEKPGATAQDNAFSQSYMSTY